LLFFFAQARGEVVANGAFTLFFFLILLSIDAFPVPSGKQAFIFSKNAAFLFFFPFHFLPSSLFPRNYSSSPERSMISNSLCHDFYAGTRPWYPQFVI